MQSANFEKSSAVVLISHFQFYLFFHLTKKWNTKAHKPNIYRSCPHRWRYKSFRLKRDRHLLGREVREGWLALSKGFKVTNEGQRTFVLHLQLHVPKGLFYICAGILRGRNWNPTSQDWRGKAGLRRNWNIFGGKWILDRQNFDLGWLIVVASDGDFRANHSFGEGKVPQLRSLDD